MNETQDIFHDAQGRECVAINLDKCAPAVPDPNEEPQYDPPTIESFFAPKFRLRPKFAAPPAASLFAFTVNDAPAMRAIDPTLPKQGVVRFDAPLETFAMKKDGADLLRLEPTDGGQEHVHLSADLYAVILESCGSSDEPKPIDKWIREGEAWARGALARMPSGPVSEWRGEPGVVRAMVADRLFRSFRLPAAEVERIAGVPPPTRGLWVLGFDADRLEEAAVARAESAAAAAAEARRVADEARRPKTAGELGLTVIEIAVDVRTGRLVIDDAPPVGDPFRQVAQPRIPPLLWETFDFQYRGCRAVEGLALPPIEEPGFRVVGGDEFVFPKYAAQEPTVEQVKYIKGLRARLGKVEARPVKEWGDDVEKAREIARRYARNWLVVPLSSNAWKPAHCVALIVRGLRIRPDVASSIILEELDAEFQRMPKPGGPSSAPPSKGTIRDEVGAACVAAALGCEPGGVSVGELLEEPATTAAKTSKRGK